MNQLRYFSSFLFIGLMLGCQGLSFGMEENTRDAFDDLIAFTDTEAGNQLLDESTFNVTRQASKPVVIVLLGNLGFFPLLQQNFFLRTNILRSRSLLDYPDYFPWRHDKDKNAIYIDLFFNETPRMFFNSDSGNICSYLAVADPALIAILGNIFDKVNEFVGGDLPFERDAILRLIDLFKTFTVQERRFGLMLGGKTKFCNGWHFHIMAPWYYLERNHFVDEEVQEDLEQLMSDIFGAPKSPEEQEMNLKHQHEFEDDYLISDKFGLGDTRIYCDFPVIKKKNLSTRLGFLATVPTAFAMKKGLKGSNFHRVQYPPTLDLQELVTALNNAVQNPENPIPDVQAFDYALTVLSNLSAMLLEAPMGNGGHFGIGTYVRNRTPLSALIKQDWARRTYMRSFISFEYLFPATEWRSFRVPVQEALFNQRDLGFTGDSESAADQAIVNSNYEFILQQLNDRLFPRVFQATVYPGFIFRWSSQVIYEGDTMGFSFGTDTYVRNKESFSHIDATPGAQAIIDIDDARSPLSYQSKICGSVFWKIEKPDRLWTVGFIGDYTFMNRGIGADFTLAFKANVMF